MAKVTNYIPEPKQEYDVENQRQILESLTTLQNQLNFSFYFLKLYFMLQKIKRK